MTIRSPELEDAVIKWIAEGGTLREFCRTNHVGVRTVYDWLDSDKELSARFARARLDGFDAIAEECFDIADDARNDWMERTRITKDGEEESDGKALDAEHVQRSKLRIETRLKLLAKWDPKRYGEKQQIEHSGNVNMGDRLTRAAKDDEQAS